MKDGSPFCKNCGAPQIRVGGQETDETGGLETDETASPTLPPPEPPEPPRAHQEMHQPWALPPPRAAAPVTSPIHWSRAVPALLIGAAVEAIFSFFGLGILLGGFLSVSIYRRRNPDQTITGSMGARLGAVTGGLAFFFISVGISMGVLLFHTGDKIRDAVMKSIEQAAARNPGPEAQAMVDSLRSPEAFAAMLAAGLLLTLIFYLVLSILGGVIGASVSRRRPT